MVASDKSMTNDCYFLDLLEPYDLLQADKGFNIQTECDLRNISLQVPPGKRGQAQMSAGAVAKTSQIANLRILARFRQLDAAMKAAVTARCGQSCKEGEGQSMREVRVTSTIFSSSFRAWPGPYTPYGDQ